MFDFGTESLPSGFTPTRLGEMMATNTQYSNRGELQEFAEVRRGALLGSRVTATICKSVLLLPVCLQSIDNKG